MYIVTYENQISKYTKEQLLKEVIAYSALYKANPSNPTIVQNGIVLMNTIKSNVEFEELKSMCDDFKARLERQCGTN